MVWTVNDPSQMMEVRSSITLGAPPCRSPFAPPGCTMGRRRDSDRRHEDVAGSTLGAAGRLRHDRAPAQPPLPLDDHALLLACPARHASREEGSARERRGPFPTSARHRRRKRIVHPSLSTLYFDFLPRFHEHYAYWFRRGHLETLLIPNLPHRSPHAFVRPSPDPVNWTVCIAVYAVSANHSSNVCRMPAPMTAILPTVI